ncbi:MAG: hypothetical protein J3Q66DRAFT_398518 [Benniella sp.]|nr:MAG: hypothetical protein J3Q66DRAFT_398518 [Benniella sp.]
MPRESLPLECLLNILHFLANQDPCDTDTMARLLRVSKTFCAATLPFLYGDCFKSIRKHHVDSKHDANITITQMIRTLLRQVHPQNRIPDLLRVAYLSQEDQDDHASMDKQSPSPPVFKYGRFVRRLVLHHSYDFHINPVMEYATIHQLFDQYVAEGVLSNNIHDDSKDKALQDALKMDIHRQLLWILCQDHMDTIEELTIPRFDIERYIDHVDQFTSLSKVIFSYSHDMYLRGYRWVTHGEEDGRSGREVAIEKRDENHKRYNTDMLQFVQQHTLIQKNVLQYVEVERDIDLDLFFKIQALLPPLHNPRSIDNSNWINFAGRLKDTNLNHVESITLDKYTEEHRRQGWGHKHWIAYGIYSNQRFLPRCRVLKKLKMYTLGPDMFQWAVQEKKQMDEARQRKRITSQHVSTRQHGYHDNGLVPLVPLRSVTIRAMRRSQPPAQELDDIAFAFSGTLENLFMRSVWRKSRDEPENLASTPQVAYGRGWDLPRLQNLALSVSHFQLYFDMNGLGRCYSLESIRLHDDIMRYNYQEVRSWSSVSLPHLKVLDLKGSPALHFNMDSLHHSPCLKTLKLGMHCIDHRGRYYSYIPSAEELERDDSDNQWTDGNEVSGMSGSNQALGSIGRRPRYTWDWYLPKLSSISLTTVFAFKFDFQWLQYLPNLEYIHLDMKSTIHNDSCVTHERHITLKDISKGQQLHQQDEDGSEEEILSDQFINLPKLTSMRFDGQWNFEEKVVETICSTVAPILENAQFGEGCAGVTPEESIALVKRMPCLKSMCLGVSRTPHEMDEILQGLGLVRWAEAPEQEKQCCKQLVFYLHGYGYHYFVKCHYLNWPRSLHCESRLANSWDIALN